jgi:hypothetical protein
MAQRSAALPQGERLQKVLAATGYGSRRICEELIAAGRVTVNGEVAILGRRVDAERDLVAVDGAPIGVRPDLVYYLLNKPVGVVTTAQAGAMPESLGLKLAWPPASSTTPPKPMASPTVRDRVGLSPNQSQATTAPNKGTVAFRMEEKPVVMCSTANEYNANGMPLLSAPTNSTGFQ